MQEYESLSARLLDLERECQRLTRFKKRSIQVAAATSAIAMIVFFGGAFRAEDRKVVSAERFELLDANGKVRGVMSAKLDSGPGLMFHDAAGLVRLELRVQPDDIPRVTVFGDKDVRDGKDGEPSFAMAQMNILNGKPGFQLYSGLNDAPEWLAVATKDGSPNMLMTKNGKIRISIGVTDQNASTIRMFNDAGKLTGELPQPPVPK